MIQNITYGVVLISIVITSFLVLLIEKTGLSSGYARLLSPEIPRFKLRSKTSKERRGEEEEITPAGRKLFGGQ